ncbi:hypothetical protein [Cypionkella sp.]|jgi:hypothetical protein|uniref:hypothetical protein n=1 Tax=Cypionkella sp. TaxID=2811411 RepID=UPI002FDEAEED
MTQSLPNSRAKRATFGAAIVFALAYFGALFFIFAPDGMLSSHVPQMQRISQP